MNHNPRPEDLTMALHALARATPEELAEVRRHVDELFPNSGHLEDQYQAAALDQLQRALARGGVDPAGVSAVVPSELPEWITLAVADTIALWGTGRARTCQHAPRMDRPRPVAAAACKPGLIVCMDCTHLLRRVGDAVPACDGCGRICAGAGKDDSLVAVEFVMGAITFSFGVCRDCADWTANASVPASCSRCGSGVHDECLNKVTDDPVCGCGCWTGRLPLCPRCARPDGCGKCLDRPGDNGITCGCGCWTGPHRDRNAS